MCSTGGRRGRLGGRYDADKNRLSLRIEGFMRDADARDGFAELREFLEAVQPIFDVVADIRGFVPASPAKAEYLRLEGEMVKARGRRPGEDCRRADGRFVAVQA